MEQSLERWKRVTRPDATANTRRLAAPRVDLSGPSCLQISKESVKLNVCRKKFPPKFRLAVFVAYYTLYAQIFVNVEICITAFVTFERGTGEIYSASRER